MIEIFDFNALKQPSNKTLLKIREISSTLGFLIVKETSIPTHEIELVFETYRDFFKQPVEVKNTINMNQTSSNRGWGPSKSEQVNSNSNPDLKEFFDSGFNLPSDDPMSNLSVYAPNQWPKYPLNFKHTISKYYLDCFEIASVILRALAASISLPSGYFDDKFNKPMALLRANYYPERPKWAGKNDSGIAAHTDYGCLTLLASDGKAGLEVQNISGEWISVSANPGEYIVNFGEMLQMWTSDLIRATPHRVHSVSMERYSIPLFFNPNYDTNVAPVGSNKTILAGDYLTKRFQQTYIHLRNSNANETP